MNEQVPALSVFLQDIADSCRYISAELTLTVAFLAVILADLFAGRRFPWLVLAVALAGIASAAGFTLSGYNELPGHPVFSGMIWPTHLGYGFKLIFYLVAALFAIFAFLNKELTGHKKGIGDLLSILLALTLGLNLMAMATNLLMVYVSVEMVSIGSYLLVAYSSARNIQSEAALKYALFGAVCSAVMLYGISLVYAFTGTLNWADPVFAERIHQLSPLSATVSLSMLLVGIGFKISAVPLHIWVPDVYEGAPTPVTAFLSAAPKLAGFALLALLLNAFSRSHPAPFDFYPVLSVSAIMAMVAGNFAAIWQDNIKRMLAYSSIGHTGFMLMSITAGSSGYSSLGFYSLVYALTTLAAFLIIDHIEEQTGTLQISKYTGFGKRFPLAMISLVVLLISLTGIPPTAGFFGKLLIFNAVWEHYKSTGAPLALPMLITGAVTTVVSLYYYFKVPLNAFLREGKEEGIAKPGGTKIALAFLLTLIVVLLGIFPGWVSGYF